MQTAGVSLLLDLYDCTSPALNNPDMLEQLFIDALKSAGFDTVEHLSHHFPIQGTTFITILQQSHAALHTWPENGFVSVDVYSCGTPAAVHSALEKFRDHLTQSLAAGSVQASFIERGLETVS
jgi:S-adenosylmethionine decarboxylase